MGLDTNCEQCCQPGDILCLNIPGGIDLQVLGINVEVCPICIRVFTEGGTLTDAQRALVNQILDSIRNLIPSV